MARRSSRGAPLEHLATCALPLRSTGAGERWYRIHRSDRDPTWFGPAPAAPPANRFDAPSREYRICYLGTTLEAAFAETMLRNPPLRLLSLRELRERSVTTYRLTRPARLVTMHGDGLARLGLTADVVHGPYDVCGTIAEALWSRTPRPDGIEYRSRHDDAQTCIALFDHAAAKLAAERTEPLMQSQRALIAILRRYGVGLGR